MRGAASKAGPLGFPFVRSAQFEFLWRVELEIQSFAGEWPKLLT